MNFQEYIQYDALGLASLVKTGQIQPSELLEIAIQQLEKVNPKINAVIYKMYEDAKKMASSVDLSAPFAGVPFLIKDLGIHVAGHPLRVGSRGFQNQISKEDSEIAKRLRKAGFLFLGKTNTPEFGLTPYTEPVLFGPTLNPWNTDHSSGGSSGGSASAVAAGIVPIATASDGGGSIRIPASCCGLFGLKPSRGRISLGNAYGDMWAGAVVENCVSRTVRDTAAYLDALRGAGIGELFILKEPARPYLLEVDQPVEKLKIAYSTQHTLGHQVDSECIIAVENTVKLLKELGHEVVETPLPYSKEALTKVFVTMIIGETSGDVEEMKQFLGRNVKVGDVELNTWLLGALGRAYTAQEYVTQKRAWNEIARKIGEFHQTYDLFLTPTMARLPIKISELQNTKAENSQLNFIKNFGLIKTAKNNGAVDKLADKAFSYIPFTPIANMTGQPAMSVPLHWSKEGLPVGVQFTARMCEEDVLIRLAAQLEKAQPWFEKRPVI